MCLRFATPDVLEQSGISVLCFSMEGPMFFLHVVTGGICTIVFVALLLPGVAGAEAEAPDSLTVSGDSAT